MVSIIIASFKEPKTIRKCISSIADRKYSGLPTPFEIIQVSPDDLTLKQGLKEAHRLNLSKRQYIQIRDPQKGKPYALKMAIQKARGDFIIFTDGDVFFEKNAVRELLKPFKKRSIGGVSGRPISIDEKNNIYGYWGHLLSDSADHRRRNTMEKSSDAEYYVSSKTFFPMSGYIMAIRRMDMPIPSDVLSDDAYISYTVRNKGLNVAYNPKAVCYVKYPTNLRDYFKQKVRSIGGFKQLKRMGVFKRDKQSRSFLIELPYAFWVFRYAKNLREFYWSLLLFPVRLMTWIRILVEIDIMNKGMPKKGWERIESTK
jgi:poly-beta-1,6-N-acetyl-D-glucosamine synthase